MEVSLLRQLEHLYLILTLLIAAGVVSELVFWFYAVFSFLDQ